MNPYVLTQSGERVDILRPDPATIRLDDIATALSRQPRFNGHTYPAVWTVAAHSIEVATLVPPELELAALLHDAAETYIGDVVAPLKTVPAVREALGPIEAGLNRAIEEAFGLEAGAVDHPEIQKADLRMLAAEKHHLMPDDATAWPVLEHVKRPRYDVDFRALAAYRQGRRAERDFSDRVRAFL